MYFFLWLIEDDGGQLKVIGSFLILIFRFLIFNCIIVKTTDLTSLKRLLRESKWSYHHYDHCKAEVWSAIRARIVVAQSCRTSTPPVHVPSWFSHGSINIFTFVRHKWSSAGSADTGKYSCDSKYILLNMSTLKMRWSVWCAIRDCQWFRTSTISDLVIPEAYRWFRAVISDGVRWNRTVISDGVRWIRTLT